MDLVSWLSRELQYSARVYALHESQGTNANNADGENAFRQSGNRIQNDRP